MQETLEMCVLSLGQEDLLDKGMVTHSNSHPPQYSCLENPLDRRAWWAIVHRVT